MQFTFQLLLCSSIKDVIHIARYHYHTTEDGVKKTARHSINNFKKLSVPQQEKGTADISFGYVQS